jgi:ATP-dependent DNA helicase RecG
MTDVQDISIDTIKGVGRARKELLRRLGVNSVADALHYYPRAYSDRREATRILDLEVGSSALIIGSVMSFSLRRFSWRKSLLTVKVSDGSGDLQAVWFNQPYLGSRFRKGQCIGLFGKVGVDQAGILQMTSPEVEDLPSEGTAGPRLLRIVPIYPATEDLSSRVIGKVIHCALEQYADRLREFLPSATRNRLGLLPLAEALRSIHFPENQTSLEQAKRRLAFQELFLLQMGAALRRRFIDATTKNRPAIPAQAEDRADRFLSHHPFSLTTAQRRSIEEIRGDLSSPRPMNRLLHGDVGCGKTIVAVWAILRAIASGCQTSLMAPTELLARQHFSEISNLLATDNCQIALLVGSASEKASLRRRIANGQTDLVIGTQALIQEKVRFKRLGLVVIDEQQRFGVVQRLKLYEKGDCPDVLVLSATPVPRTLCQTLYGDMEVSVIDEVPPGRLPVQTECFSPSEFHNACERLQAVIRSGNRAYVVCPRIAENGASERTSAVETHRRFARDVFPDMRIGLLHGAMDPAEKEDSIRKFRKGLLDILVSTTVIETGIDIPDAAAILITDAECFGLAQLHQMRGRVGRGGEQGYCLVVADPKTESAMERLRVFQSTNDGFQIAREDLRLRGVGEFFGTRQHGLSEVGMTNILEDPELMQVARKEAFGVVNGDICLSPEEKEDLAEEMGKAYGEKLRLGFV